jgi:ATP-dependent DNA ligase
MPLPRLGFVPPCLPTKAPQPPTGDAWVHEIKHDGFRVLARKDGDRVRLSSRPGNDLTWVMLIVESLSTSRPTVATVFAQGLLASFIGHL